MSIDAIGAITSIGPSPPLLPPQNALALRENVRDGSLVIDTYGGGAVAAPAVLATGVALALKTAPLVAPVEPVAAISRGYLIDVYV